MAADPTIAALEQEPEWERTIDVTGWDVGDVAEYTFGHRRHGEPATLEVGYGNIDDSPFVELSIGHPKPLPPLLLPASGHYPVMDGDTQFDDDVLDLPDIK